MFALTFSISSGVTWRMPCSLACSAAFCITSSLSTTYDVFTPARRVNLGAFQHLGHWLASLISFHDEHYLTVGEEAMPFLSIDRCSREDIIRKPSTKRTLVTCITLMIGPWLSGAAMAQMDHGPKTDKTWNRTAARSCVAAVFRQGLSGIPAEARQEAYKILTARA